MIQTLEAEIDERGSVKFASPVHFDRKHRVLVMVMPDEAEQNSDEAEDWHQPYVDQAWRHLPQAS